MSTYGDDLTRLAASVAELVATGPRQTDLARPSRVLAARDIVWRGIGSLTDAASAPMDQPSLTGTGGLGRPAERQVQRLLLAHLDVSVAEDDHALDRIQQLRRDDEPWRRAAISAVGMEQHTTGLRRLDQSGKAALLGDVAQLVIAMTYCEQDLQRRTSAVQTARGRLLDPQQLLGIRTAAAQLQAAVADTDRPAHLDAVQPDARRPLVVLRHDGIPDGLDRLGRLWEQANEVGIRDIVLTANALQHVLDTTQRHLGRRHEQLDGQVHTLRTDLARLAQHRTHFASLVPSPTPIEIQCRIIADAARTRLRTADRGLAARTTRALVAVTETALQGIDRALRAGQLLQLAGPGDAQPAGPRLMWVSNLACGSEERAGLRADAEAVSRTAKGLPVEAATGVVGSLHAGPHLAAPCRVSAIRDPQHRVQQRGLVAQEL